MTNRTAYFAISGAALAIAFLGCSKKESDGDKAGGPSGPYAEAAAYVMKAANAALKHASTGEADEAWGLTADAASAEVAETLKSFANPKIVFAVFELEGMSAEKYLRTSATAFPSGRLAWMQVELRDEPAGLTASAALEKASPALFAAYREMIATLGGEQCKDLPLVVESDVSMLPADAQRAFLKAHRGHAKSCPLALADGPWQPRVDDLTLLLESDGKFAQLRTSFQVKDGKMQLGKPRVRRMP